MKELFPESAPVRDAVVQQPSAENLRAFFKARIREWRYPMFSGEAFTVGTFDDLSTRIDETTAFSLIPTALEIVLGWDRSEISETALALMADLAAASKTTEVPHALEARWAELEDVVERNQLGESQFWQHLLSWYRKRPNKSE